jgi:hypothetical protein
MRQLVNGLKEIHEILHWRGVMVTPVEGMKAYRGCRRIDPRILNLGARRRLWVVNFMPRPLRFSGESLGTR